MTPKLLTNDLTGLYCSRMFYTCPIYVLYPCYVIVNLVANRPLVMPEIYNGETSWDQWIYHFENVTVVNKWDEAARLCWLNAQTALQRLPSDADYKSAKKALQERFEPSCRKERYQAQFQARQKKKDEGRADLADGLRNLVDKAYPELEDKAKGAAHAEPLFLSQIKNHTSRLV